MDSSLKNVFLFFFSKVCKCWEKLELAHDSYIEKTDIDVDTHKDGFQYLDAPIIRVASLDTPVPFAKNLENQFLPKERFKNKLSDDRKLSENHEQTLQ